jgi:hypothetical protein
MKVEVGDIEEVFEQIVRMAPPTQKEDHKFLNSLRKLIEKNVIVNPGPGIQELAEKNEQRDLAVSSLSFLRRDMPLELRNAFLSHMEETKAILSARKERVCRRKEMQVPEYLPSDGPSMEEMEKIAESISAVMAKLERARLIVEDAHSKSAGKCLEPSVYAENFFRNA